MCVLRAVGITCEDLCGSYTVSCSLLVARVQGFGFCQRRSSCRVDGQPCGLHMVCCVQGLCTLDSHRPHCRKYCPARAHKHSAAHCYAPKRMAALGLQIVSRDNTHADMHASVIFGTPDSPLASFAQHLRRRQCLCLTAAAHMTLCVHCISSCLCGFYRIPSVPRFCCRMHMPGPSPCHCPRPCADIHASSRV